MALSERETEVVYNEYLKLKEIEKERDKFHALYCSDHIKVSLLEKEAEQKDRVIDEMAEHIKLFCNNVEGEKIEKEKLIEAFYRKIRGDKVNGKGK